MCYDVIFTARHKYLARVPKMATCPSFRSIRSKLTFSLFRSLFNRGNFTPFNQSVCSVITVTTKPMADSLGWNIFFAIHVEYYFAFARRPCRSDVVDPSFGATRFQRKNIAFSKGIWRLKRLEPDMHRGRVGKTGGRATFGQLPSLHGPPTA